MNDITNKIEKLRAKLHFNIDRHGLDSKQVRKTSDELDRLINEYYNSKKYSEDSDMYKAYNKSLEDIQMIIDIFGNFPTTKEWNKYAKEQGLLSVASLEYISGCNWHGLKKKFVEKNRKFLFDNKTDKSIENS